MKTFEITLDKPILSSKRLNIVYLPFGCDFHQLQIISFRGTIELREIKVLSFVTNNQ